VPKISLDVCTYQWKVIRKRAGLLGMASTGHKYLRKTAAQMIRDGSVDGLELSEGFLAHQTASVGAAYHKFGKWDQLAEAVMKLRSAALPEVFHAPGQEPGQDTESDAEGHIAVGL
jgi:hypothetical protein